MEAQQLDSQASLGLEIVPAWWRRIYHNRRLFSQPYDDMDFLEVSTSRMIMPAARGV